MSLLFDMKKIVNIIALCGFALLLSTGCNKNFLDTEPKSSIGEGTATSNITNLEYILNGVHNYFYNNWDTQGYTGFYSYNIINDMMGEDVINSTTGNGWYIREMRWVDANNPNSSQVYYTYYYFYKIIQNVNSALNNYEKLGDTSDKAGAIKGEALAIRAFCYFQLVQRYGKRYAKGQDNSQLGVPLRTEVEFAPKERATVEAIYKLINDDLDEAIVLLSKSDKKDVNRVNLLTAKGFKARVALAQQDWATAAKQAKEVIDLAPKYGHNLQKGEELLSGFNSISKNKEFLWAYTQTTDQNMYFGSFFAYMSWNFSSSNIRSNPKVINSALYDQMSETDIRRYWWDPEGNGAIAKMYGTRPSNFSTKPYNSFKFAAQATGISSGDFVFMRLAEMYYIAAEAYARNGKNAEAQQMLATVMTTRDPKYTMSSSTGQALIDEIMTNRRIDLWGEGHRWTDLKRLDQALDRTVAPNTDIAVSLLMNMPAGDKRWQFAIPKEEIDASKELVKQNDL